MVSRRLCDATARSPVLSSAKQPVPYVDFIMPGVKQACPTVAACWSPATPRIGIAPPRIAVVPKAAGAIQTRPAAAPAEPGTSPQAPHPTDLYGCRTTASAPHWWHRLRARARRSAARSGSCRRCRRRVAPPPPRRVRPRHDRATRRSLSRRNTDREQARSCAAIAASWPAARKAAQMSSVRRSCHTIALWIGLPVARSQISVVSR